MRDIRCPDADQAAGERNTQAPGWLGHVVVLTGYLAGAVAVTWHLWASPSGHVVAGNPHDADAFAWYMRDAATSVSHARLPALITTRLNAPQGISLMWNTSVLLPGVLLAPITLLAGPQVSLTVLMTAGFAGSAAAMMAVLRRWRMTLGPAALAGALYGFSPALAQSAIGHYNLQFAVLPPLIIDAGLRLFFVPAGPGETVCPDLRQRIRTGIWLGLLAAAQFFIAEEMLALSALTGVLLLVCLAATRPVVAIRQLRDPRWLAGAAAAAAVALVIVGTALLSQFAGPLTQSGSPYLVDYFKNDLTVFVDASSYVLWHTAPSATAAAGLPGGAPEQLGYLGWPIIMVLTAGAAIGWRDRRIRAFALAFLILEVLSLGAHLEVVGVTNPHVTLPWQWLKMLPALGLALPDRLSITADGFAAALLALLLDRFATGVSAIRPGRAAAVRAAAVLAVLLPLTPAPLPAAGAPALPSGWSAVLSSLHLTPGARVLIVPVPEPTLTAAMRWQASTGTDISLIGGYFIGPASNGLAYVGGNGPRPTASYLDALWLATPPGRLAVSQGASLPPSTPPAIPPPGTVLSDFAYWRPAAVIADTTAHTALGRYLISILGSPSLAQGSVVAWRLSRAAG